MDELLTRDEFRERVFERDKHKCVVCEEPAVDAHHIIERRLFGPTQGYHIDNGASVCEQHHLACEMTTISVEDIRAAAGIRKVVVPDQFYPEQPITKWGDYVLEDGRRTRGELFYDESVQKILATGGVLDLYTPYVKYGRTMHLPWSPGIHDDDKALKNCDNFVGKRVIITEKFDGENTSGYSDGHVHARSIDSRGGEDRAWVKRFLTENVCYNLPEGWRVCGENVWAEHSISYHNLSSYFYGFSIWNERNQCLPWDETVEWFAMLDITPPPVLFDGLWDDASAQQFGKLVNTRKSEGFVVRTADGFSYGQFQSCVAKWVRAGHVQTTKHWRSGQRLTPNKLASQNENQ